MAGLKNGWIKLNRSIQDNWLWKEKPFDKARAWIDLILMANYEEHKLFSRNRLYTVHAGEIITSYSKLGERWGWDKKTVKRFLLVLQSDHMLSLKCSRQWTTISLINYGKFQKPVPTERTTKRTTDSPFNPHSMDMMKEGRRRTEEDLKERVTVLPSEDKGLPAQTEVEDDDDEGWMNPDEIVLPEVFR